MTIVLASKPGLSSATTLSIPKEWDATWFRNLINNQLKGADVRNASGTNGIKVSGNIASPYATITLAAPIILTPSAGGTGIAVSNPGANSFFVLTWSNSAGSGDITLTNGGTTQVHASGQIQIFTGGTARLTITANGSAISGWGPTAAALVDMTPDSGSFTMAHSGFTTAVTSTATWYRIGNLVIINTGTVTGTSNATTWIGSGVPAALQAARAQVVIIGDATDAGAGTAANVAITSANTNFTFGKNFTSGGAWTNTGAKGFGNTGGTTFAYLIN